jgi:putative ABC transport system substrate-binding protein
LGWVDGRNIRIDYRWGGGDADTIRRQATELVALTPDVIFASGGPATERLLQLTRTVPILFVAVPDPVGSGLVVRLSQPGGNATGFMLFEYNLTGKWLELLKQVAPHVTRAAVLRDPAITAGIGQFAAIQSAAPSVGIEVSAAGETTPKRKLVSRRSGWVCAIWGGPKGATFRSTIGLSGPIRS